VTVPGARYVDPSTGRTYPLTEARWRAESGHPLDLTPGPGLARGDIETSRYSVWRYARGLRVAAEHAVSLGEGWTPLVAGDFGGTPVLYKLEFVMPTGSFKDRGTTVMVSYLKSRGIDRVLEDSSGNAGASLAAYAAAAGMRCRILVPQTASYPKIAQIAATGADVVTVEGSRQDVADAALRQSAEIFYASHNWQPFFVEGVKTLAYELWEQLGFRAPDNVVVPLGYGSNVLGCDRGFAELARLRAVPRRVPGGGRAPRPDPHHLDGRRGHRLGPPDPRRRGAAGRAGERGRRRRGGRGGDRRRAGRPGPPGALRRAHGGGGRRGPGPAGGEWCHPAARDDRAGADRLGAEGVGHHRRAAEAGPPARCAMMPAA
jgi:hypothetical protein